MNIKNLLTRSRNLLSHPPLWWKENEESRRRLIGELDAAIHEKVAPCGEPVAEVGDLIIQVRERVMADGVVKNRDPLYTAPPPAPVREPVAWLYQTKSGYRKCWHTGEQGYPAFLADRAAASEFPEIHSWTPLYQSTSSLGK